MRYKIGNKVRIRTDLEQGEYYYDQYENYSDSVNESMSELGGMIVTITALSGRGGYRINLDNGEWNWMDDMFIGKVTNEDNKSPFQMWETNISQ